MVCGGWNGTKELYAAWKAELVLGGRVVYSWVLKIEATLDADVVNVARSIRFLWTETNVNIAKYVANE